MDGELIKWLLGLGGIVVYFFLSSKKMRDSVPPQEKAPPPAPKILNEKLLSKKSLIHREIPQDSSKIRPAPEMNPVFFPKKATSRVRSLIRSGRSKKEAILLSEIFKNPYLP